MNRRAITSVSRILSVPLIGLTVASCTAEVGDDPTPQGIEFPEPIGVLSQALDTTWVTPHLQTVQQTFGQWGRKDPLPSASTHVCVLTQVAGSFQGAGEWIDLNINNGVWSLDIGAVGFRDIAAGTRCFAKNKFRAWGGERSDWISPPLHVWSAGCNTPPPVHWDTGDSAIFLGAFQGFLGGQGERAEVTQGGSIFNVNSVYGSTCRYNQDEELFGPPALSIWGNSFYAGPTRWSWDTLQGAQFIGPGDVRGPVQVAGTFVASGYSPVQTIMAPANQAMCGLTKIQGDFNGAGENVFIDTVVVNGVERWRLNVFFMSPGWVNAAARCYLRDQVWYFPE